MSNHWRIIISEPGNGPWNMALDEAFLLSTAKEYQPPTLRFYTWEPYCLSIGHAQKVSEIDVDSLYSLGWDIVRRPTGGRGILHADELTYSITAPENYTGISGSIIDSYRMISSGLIIGLKNIGIHANSKPKDVSKKYLSKDPICFQYPSDYEITFEGKKLIGSAQARRHKGILQHGAIPLHGDITRIISVLKFNTNDAKFEAKQLLQQRATSIEMALGVIIQKETLINKMIDGFEEALNIKLVVGKISMQEFNSAKDLLENKYNNPEWTYRI